MDSQGDRICGNLIREAKLWTAPFVAVKAHLIKRTTDLKLYIMKCEIHGEVELTLQEERKPTRIHYDGKNKLGSMLKSTNLFKKKP